MSDYGRYGDDTRSRHDEDRYRDRDRERSGRGGSIFNYGARDTERSRNFGRYEDMGGRAGFGRMSAYDDRDRERGGRWTEERENLSFGGGRHRERHREHRMDRDRDMDRGRDRERMDRDRDREQSYGRDDHRDGIPVEETSRLIASNKVEGTAVYGSDGARLGSIYNFMVNKYSGRVEYAVMSYGGFLGMGMRYYPLPWRTLTYDTDMGGYRIQMTERDLKDAPSFDRDSEPKFDRNYGERVHSWYGLDY